MTKRVVITGMGVVSPIGNDIDRYWSNLKNGVCGISRITEFPADDLPAKVAAFVKDFNPAEYGMEPAFARKQDLFTLYAEAATYQALKQSGLDSSEEGNIDPMRFGVYIGTGIGGFHTIYREVEKMIKDGAKWVSPLFIPTMIPNMAAGNVSIRHNACGPSLAITTACATSTHTIGEAFRAIKHGYADAIIAGGSEAVLIPMGVAGFGNAKALSRSEDPDYASLPFNANRGGFVMGEGAGVMILEEYEHAIARGAKPIAEICGYGNTSDAYHVTAPRPDSKTQSAAIRLALDEAGYIPGKDILHINSHGTGTKLNDSNETVAFKMALGEDEARRAHINSIKSMIGHPLGAAGALEAIAATLALHNNTVPPTIHLDTPDPECDLDYTPNKCVETELTMAISDSLGFGGHNACIAIRKAK